MINKWQALLSERAAEWQLPTAVECSCLFNNNYQPNYSSKEFAMQMYKTIQHYFEKSTPLGGHLSSAAQSVRYR